VELDTYLEKERLAAEKEAQQQAARAKKEQHMLEADEGDSDTDSEDDEDEVERTLGGDIDGGGISNPVSGGRRRNQDNDWEMDVDEGPSKSMLSYDIYLKGNVSKATSFFKSSEGQRERFRMFPYVERKKRVDEYGETIDVAMWMRKGKVLEDANKEGKEMEVVEEDESKVCATCYFG
jgi:cleavage and polyadenylation specificity factor subunit 2